MFGIGIGHSLQPSDHTGSLPQKKKVVLDETAPCLSAEGDGWYF